MSPLVGVPLPFVIVSKGKLELIGNPFVHFVLHHGHAVGFRAAPRGRAQGEEEESILLLLVGRNTLIQKLTWMDQIPHPWFQTIFLFSFIFWFLSFQGRIFSIWKFPH